MSITHNHLSFVVECVKFCKVQDSTRIYLFRVLKQPIIAGHYIVAAKRDDETLYFMQFIDIKVANQFYLDIICQYA